MHLYIHEYILYIYIYIYIHESKKLRIDILMCVFVREHQKFKIQGYKASEKGMNKFAILRYSCVNVCRSQAGLH